MEPVKESALGSLWQDVKNKLDSVSPSFCLAKWKHCSMHLLTGHTHSCYLPQTHKVPLSELSKSPTALHNTCHKKAQRKKMLAGTRPDECKICWEIEDLPGTQLSDRIIRGNQAWTAPYFDEIRSAPWDANTFPAYLEVSFSSACNFRCSYCSPHVSSAWMEEIKREGPYRLSEHGHQDLRYFAQKDLIPLPEENNPYVDAFWKWWPELYSQLKVFRITGGEPLLSKHTFRVLDWISEHPNPELSLDVNSNLGVPDKIFEKFLFQAEELMKTGKIRRVSIHTSVDSWGAQAEYIRNGLRFDTFWKNVHRTLETIPSCGFYFMCTFNALSVVGFQAFLENLLKLRKKFSSPSIFIQADFPHLMAPEFLSARILPGEYHDYIRKMLAYMEDKMRSPGSSFLDFEFQKMRRILSWVEAVPDPVVLARNRRDFYLYFSEHDRRRGTNFLQTFPEMKGFWALCKSLAEQ